MLFDYAYAAFGIAATVFARHFVPLHCRPWAKPGALVAMIAASLCIIAAPHAPDAAVVLSGASALLGAFGFCAVLLMFNEAIVPLSLVRIALYTAASRFIAVPLTYLCQGLSGDRMALVLVILPLAATASIAVAIRALPSGTVRLAPTRSSPSPGSPWQYCASMPSPTACARLNCPMAPASIRRCPRRWSWAASSWWCISSPIGSR